MHKLIKKMLPGGNLDFNEDMESAIRESADLFDEAKSTIKIVSGKLNAKFYDDERIIDALKRAQDRNVNIHIIYGPGIKSDICSILRGNHPEQLHEYERDSAPRQHFMVIDRKHVRLEEPHEPEAKEVQAQVNRNTFFLGDRLDRDFERMKPTSSASKG